MYWTLFFYLTLFLKILPVPPPLVTRRKLVQYNNPLWLVQKPPDSSWQPKSFLYEISCHESQWTSCNKCLWRTFYFIFYFVCVCARVLCDWPLGKLACSMYILAACTWWVFSLLEKLFCVGFLKCIMLVPLSRKTLDVSFWSWCHLSES